MPGRAWFATPALLLMLVPAAWFAWTWRTMPQLGGNHDELLYYIGGKSLAEGRGYRVLSLPGEPHQTKYPPGLSAVSAIAWRLGGPYPDNLAVHTLACWLFLAASLFGFHRLLREMAFSPGAALALSAAWSLNAYAFQFSTTLLSELPFTALLLACLLCLNRPGRHWAFAAGMVAAAAFLTRTMGLLLLPAAALWLWRSRRRGEILHFCAPPLAAAAAWFAWTAAHKPAGTNAVSLYYLNYLGYHMKHFLWDEPWLALWKNADGILSGPGALLMPQTGSSMADKLIAQTLTVGGIAGVVRLARSGTAGVGALYAGFAACMAAALAVWSFPADERLMLPVAPLLLAGMWAEGTHLGAGLRKSWHSPKTADRAAACVVAAVLAGLGAYCLHAQWQLVTGLMPETNRRAERRLSESEPMMAWIRENLAADAAVLDEFDPVFYLRSGGRHAARIFTSPGLWYRGDHDEQLRQYAAVDSYAAENGLRYLLLGPDSFSQRFSADYQQRLLGMLRSHERLSEMHRASGWTLYRIETAPSPKGP